MKREGTYVFLWPIHVDVWQKPTQHCKAIILHKSKKKKKKVCLKQPKQSLPDEWVTKCSIAIPWNVILSKPWYI